MRLAMGRAGGVRPAVLGAVLIFGGTACICRGDLAVVICTGPETLSPSPPLSRALTCAAPSHAITYAAPGLLSARPHQGPPPKSQLNGAPHPPAPLPDTPPNLPAHSRQTPPLVLATFWAPPHSQAQAHSTRSHAMPCHATPRHAKPRRSSAPHLQPCLLDPPTHPLTHPPHPTPPHLQAGPAPAVRPRSKG
jgi:hypothetical protein